MESSALPKRSWWLLAVSLLCFSLAVNWTFDSHLGAYFAGCLATLSSVCVWKAAA